MTAPWPRRTLGDVLSVQNGYAFDSKAFGYTGFPLIRIRDLKAGVSTETRYGGEFDPKYVVNAGDFLIGMDGEFGCYEWRGEPALLNQRVCRLQDFDQALEPRFLFYGINAYLKAIEEVTGYTTVKHLSSKQVLGIEMPVPPLPEQRRIVAILDEAFEGIATAKANAEKNLQNALQVFETHLERVFRRRCDLWPETSLGSIAEIKGGKRVPKGYKLLDEDTGYPYLRVTDFGLRGSIDTHGLRYVSASVHAQIKNYIITPRDLYISIAGTIGRTGIIPDELDGANLTENACRLVFKPGVNNRFVYYYTKTPAFIEQAGLNTRTAAQPKLALSRLATIRLPMPKLDTQESMVTTLDAIAESVEVLEGIYQSKAVALQELKKSLLHQAFTGALTGKSTDKQVAEVA